MTCSVCHEGELQPQRIDHLVERGGRIALVHNLSALVCDECSHRFFTRDAIDQIEAVADDSNDLIPNDFAFVHVFDVDDLQHAPQTSVPSFDAIVPDVQPTEVEIRATPVGTPDGTSA